MGPQLMLFLMSPSPLPIAVIITTLLSPLSLSNTTVTVTVTYYVTVGVTVRSSMAPAKPLSADEIVKANAKKRANGAQLGGPAKVGRLDAATMAALGKRGPGLLLSQLLAQSPGPASGQGRGQLLGQTEGQHAGVPLCSSCLPVPAWHPTCWVPHRHREWLQVSEVAA